MLIASLEFTIMCYHNHTIIQQNTDIKWPTVTSTTRLAVFSKDSTKTRPRSTTRRSTSQQFAGFTGSYQWKHLQVSFIWKILYWLVVEPTPLKNMLVKMGSSSPNRGEHTKCLKPLCHFVCGQRCLKPPLCHFVSHFCSATWIPVYNMNECCQINILAPRCATIYPRGSKRLAFFSTSNPWTYQASM